MTDETGQASTAPMALALAEAPLEAWRRSFAPAIEGLEVDCGHFVAEEAPQGTLAALQRFLEA